MVGEYFLPDESNWLPPKADNQPPEVYIEQQLSRLQSKLESLIAQREIMVNVLKGVIDRGIKARIEKNQNTVDRLNREISQIRKRINSLKSTIDQPPLFSE